ncbi:MAG: M23 family metallopeptidase [Bacteroidetes bacterium]|nr:M23 family metallopeptidase [Bacteroidota bacterium]
MATEAKEKKLIKKLRTTLRLVVMNDSTFEENFSLRLTPLNLAIVTGSVMLVLVTLTIYLVAFTPLREYIPGYADVGMKRKLISMAYTTDSLTRKIEAQNSYLNNLNSIINGDLPATKLKDTSTTKAFYDSIRVLQKTVEDSLLRANIESGAGDEALDGDASTKSGIASVFFFNPVSGTDVSHYEPVKKHWGIDVVSDANATIKATLDGTVVIAEFTSETGHVLAIQHSNNLISLYKHNSSLLKKEGDYVRAGDAIAIIGNSGELTTGPHLHFELWYNGTPVNPVDFIKF